MRGDALTAMEQLDRSRRDAHVDLSADERMRDRVVEAVDLDVIVEIGAHATPFRVFPVGVRQRRQSRLLDALEQRAPADAELPHRTIIQAIERRPDRRVAFGEQERV